VLLTKKEHGGNKFAGVFHICGAGCSGRSKHWHANLAASLGQMLPISGVVTILIEVVGVDLSTHGEVTFDLELSSGSDASGVLTGRVPKTQGVKT